MSQGDLTVNFRKPSWWLIATVALMVGMTTMYWVSLALLLWLNHDYGASGPRIIELACVIFMLLAIPLLALIAFVTGGYVYMPDRELVFPGICCWFTIILSFVFFALLCKRIIADDLERSTAGPLVLGWSLSLVGIPTVITLTALGSEIFSNPHTRWLTFIPGLLAMGILSAMAVKHITVKQMNTKVQQTKLAQEEAPTTAGIDESALKEQKEATKLMGLVILVSIIPILLAGGGSFWKPMKRAEALCFLSFDAFMFLALSCFGVLMSFYPDRFNSHSPISWLILLVSTALLLATMVLIVRVSCIKPLPKVDESVRSSRN